MSSEVERRLEKLLDGCERRGSCLHPGESCNRQALARRTGEGGSIFSPARGLYVKAKTWDGLDEGEKTLWLMRGFQSMHPDWTFCGPSAALAYGADVSYELLRPLHVAAPGRSWSNGSALVRRHLLLPECPEDDPVWVRGVRVTTLSRTTFDCLRWMSFREAMPVADMALRGRPGFACELERYFGRLRGRCSGVDQALRTLSYADGRSESGGESIARAVMIEHGYVLPLLQVEVPNPLDPGHVFRVDFVWRRADGAIIIGECDGRRKLFDPEMTRGRTPEQVLADQRSREGLLTAYNVTVMRFTFEEAREETGLLRKLELYGVPKIGTMLAPSSEVVPPDWPHLLRT